jgi:hypothetical protein
MNTSQIPPGGWQWHEAATGWWAPHPIGHTFDQQVQNIIKHRSANPAITAKHKLPTDPTTVGRQLIQFQQARGALPPDSPPKLTPPPLSLPRMSGAVVGAVAVVKKLAAGAATLLEWEESGMPHVEPEVAENRASVCARCPKNQQGKSLTEYFTVPVSDLFNKRFRKMDELNLRTTYDDQLNVCQACLCPMRTKVWFPTDMVVKRLKPEQKSQLNQANPRCWILDL